MKKILCLCDYGQVRSVAMATLLRNNGYVAFSGAADNYDELEDESYFDLVIHMETKGKHFIGNDMWGNCDHPVLRDKCYNLAFELGLFSTENKETRDFANMIKGRLNENNKI